MPPAATTSSWTSEAVAGGDRYGLIKMSDNERITPDDTSNKVEPDGTVFLTTK